MKASRPIAAALLTLGLFACGVQAQESPKPTAEHKQLAQLEGEWEGQITCHYLPKEAKDGKGVLKVKMDLNGLFQFSHVNGQLGGQSFEGRGATGYDTFQKKFTGAWVDTMSTAMYHTTGAFDASGKVFTEHMEGPDPKGGKMKMRLVTTLRDQDHMHWAMHGPGTDGREILMMEISYTRKK